MSLNKLTELEKGFNLKLKIGCEDLKCKKHSYCIIPNLNLRRSRT